MRRSRAAALLVAAASAAAALLRQLPAAPGDGPDSLIVEAATWVASGAAAYLLVCIAVAATRQLLAADTTRPVRALAGTPGWARTLLAVALGTTVIAASAGPAGADEGTPHRRAAVVRLGWPVAAGDPAAGAVAAKDAEGRTVIVEAGDSLWSIAADALASGTGATAATGAARATSAAVAREWPRWWRANREVIGEHPDLIRPGERLVPPPRRTPTDPRSLR